MATTQAPPEPTADRLDAPPPRRRRLTARLSTGHVVMLAAGLLAAVANFAFLRGQAETTAVLVAAGELPAGVAVAVDDLRVVDVEIDAAIADALVPAAQRDGTVGQVTVAPIPAGAPLRAADLRRPASDAGLRRMSVPVPRERAAGGTVAVGDRVDLIETVDGTARYVLAGAEVLAVDTGSGAALTSAGFSLTIAVDADTALCVARALQTGSLDVIVSTGTAPAPVAPCHPEPAPDAGDDPAGKGAAGEDAVEPVMRP